MARELSPNIREEIKQSFYEKIPIPHASAGRQSNS